MKAIVLCLSALVCGCATSPMPRNWEGKVELAPGEYVMIRPNQTDQYRCMNPSLSLQCVTYSSKVECTCTTVD